MSTMIVLEWDGGKWPDIPDTDSPVVFRDRFGNSSPPPIRANCEDFWITGEPQATHSPPAAVRLLTSDIPPLRRPRGLGAEA